MKLSWLSVAWGVIALLSGPFTVMFIWLLAATAAETGFLVFTAHTFQNMGATPGILLVGVTPGGFEKSFEKRQGAEGETLRSIAEKYIWK